MIKQVRVFRLTIPVNHDHESQFELSYAQRLRALEEKDERYLIPPPRRLPVKFFTNERFGQVSHRLIPGKVYTVRMFENEDDYISTWDCLKFLRLRKSYLVGAHGLSVILQADKIPDVYGSILSFDEPALLEAIPRINREDEGEWSWTTSLQPESDESGDWEDLYVPSSKFVSFEEY
jgi:hypothetical protein